MTYKPVDDCEHCWSSKRGCLEVRQAKLGMRCCSRCTHPEAATRRIYRTGFGRAFADNLGSLFKARYGQWIDPVEPVPADGYARVPGAPKEWPDVLAPFGFSNEWQAVPITSQPTHTFIMTAKSFDLGAPKAPVSGSEIALLEQAAAKRIEALRKGLAELEAERTKVLLEQLNAMDLIEKLRANTPGFLSMISQETLDAWTRPFHDVPREPLTIEKIREVAAPAPIKLPEPPPAVAAMVEQFRMGGPFAEATPRPITHEDVRAAFALDDGPSRLFVSAETAADLQAELEEIQKPEEPAEEQVKPAGKGGFEFL